MAFITLISDYGHNSPYLAAVKGVILSNLPDVKIVDISHTINPHDILQAAYILKNSTSNFPNKTVHIISVDSSFAKHQQFLIVEHKTQFYIGADNGIFSLLFNDEPENVYAVNSDLIKENDLFPDKNLFVNLATRIINGEEINKFSTPSSIKNIKQNVAPVVEENLIRGIIVFIDGYGNAITNISRNLFEKKNNDKKRFAIFYRRKDKITYISKNYSDVKYGEELALFNESEMLEIAMNTGKSSQLLGISEGSKIIIEFYD
jgi:S-adenosyl-L-methionine hydrolase (adenosine-forming)